MVEVTADFTPEKKAKFLKALTQMPNVSRACRLARTSRTTAYNHRNADSAFAAAWDEALDIGIETLEEEAHIRAFKGRSEPVFYQGAKVGQVKRYSDTLAIFLLKAHRPEKYRERHEISGKDGGPVIVQVTYVNSYAAPDDA